MRHIVETNDFEGYTVETDIASTTGGFDHAKALTVVTTIGEVTTTLFRVTDRTERIFRDYTNLGDAILDYNDF